MTSRFWTLYQNRRYVKFLSVCRTSRNAVTDIRNLLASPGKRHLFTRLLGSVVLLVLTFGLASGSDLPIQPIVRLAADPWCPYNCRPSDRHPGYMIELAQEILIAHGYRVAYQTLPWSRALREARQGRIDGAVGATHQNGKGLTFGKQALGIDHTVVATLNGSALSYNGPHSLDGLRIGIIADYGYDNGGPIDRYLAERIQRDPNSIVLLATDHALQQLIDMLTRHRIDVLFANSNVLAYHLKTMELQGSVRVQDTEAYDIVGIAFTPNARGKELARLMDEGLLAMRQNGQLEKILAVYGLKDWDTQLPLIHRDTEVLQPRRD